jgi:hypothetical protein
MGRLIGWRIQQLLEVIFVSSKVNVHFCLVVIAAFRAVLPPPLVSFLEMMTAECVAPVVATATVAGIREQDVLIFVVADPLAATFASCEVLSATAQSALGTAAFLCTAGT